MYGRDDDDGGPLCEGPVLKVGWPRFSSRRVLWESSIAQRRSCTYSSSLILARGVPCHSCGSLLSRIVVGWLSPSLLCVQVLARPLVAVAAARCAAGLHACNLAGIIVPPGGVDYPPPGCIVGTSQVVAWLRWCLCVLGLRSGIRMVKGFSAALMPLTRRWMSVPLI